MPSEMRWLPQRRECLRGQVPACMQEVRERLVVPTRGRSEYVAVLEQDPSNAPVVLLGERARASFTNGVTEGRNGRRLGGGWCDVDWPGARGCGVGQPVPGDRRPSGGRRRIRGEEIAQVVERRGFHGRKGRLAQIACHVRERSGPIRGGTAARVGLIVRWLLRAQTRWCDGGAVRTFGRMALELARLPLGLDGRAKLMRTGRLRGGLATRLRLFHRWVRGALLALARSRNGRLLAGGQRWRRLDVAGFRSADFAGIRGAFVDRRRLHAAGLVVVERPLQRLEQRSLGDAALLVHVGEARRAGWLDGMRGHSSPTFFQEGAGFGTQPGVAGAGRNAAGWPARIRVGDVGDGGRPRLAEDRRANTRWRCGPLRVRRFTQPARIGDAR